MSTNKYLRPVANFVKIGDAHLELEELLLSVFLFCSQRETESEITGDITIKLKEEEALSKNDRGVKRYSKNTDGLISNNLLDENTH